MLQADGDVVLFMDADLATPLKYINEALSQINSGNDLSICVRNLQKSHKGLRKLISGFGNFLVQLLLLPGINDTQCGFKAFTRESVKVIFPLQTIDGWGFDMEVLAIARKKGYHIGLMNVPDWKDVTKGSKISGSSPIKASLQTFGDLLKIRWQIIRGKYKH
jgi:dolichyl-phosphate beta-glucosyltransferase